MAIKLRLARHGAKKAPFYRIVAADSRARRDGRFLEVLGMYDPTTEVYTLRLKPKRIRYWLGVGAKPTETVASILKRHLDEAERRAAEHELDDDMAVWVQGPDNAPAAQGVKGGPAYRPFRRPVQTPAAPAGTDTEGAPEANTQAGAPAAAAQSDQPASASADG